MTVVATGLCVTVGLAVQLSLTVAALKIPIEALQLVSAFTVGATGQVMDGGITSFSVTTKVQVAVFPLPSLAVSVMVCAVLWPVMTVVAIGLWVTAGLAAQLSLTDTAL
jgi:hypothetical protein